MNIQELLESIDSLAARAKLSRNSAFAAWYAINFGGLDEDDALEAASVDGGNDQGIDIIYADEQYQKIFILQSFVPGSDSGFEKSTKLEKWNALVGSIPYVTNPTLLRESGRNDLADLIEEIKENNPNFQLSFGLISLGVMNSEINRSVSATQSIHNDLHFFFISKEEIINDYQALIEDEGGVPEDKISFTNGFIKDIGSYGESYIGSISALELIRLHNAHPQKIFSGNIRLFLGSRKGGINEKIIKTAKEKPDHFWALNNGITIVADSISEDTASSIIVKRFSIVNGCQTTSCLVSAGNDGKNAKVLARVIAAKSGSKNDIVLYNNSQNAIKIWAVRAADDTQEILKKRLKEVGIEYAPKQKGSKKQNGENIIELDKIAQYLAASRQEFLIQSINNKAELFEEPYTKIFKKGMQPQEVLIAWTIGTLADCIRSEQLEKMDKDEYSGLLSVQSTLWIVYTTYKLIEKFSNIKSEQITLKKILTSEFESSLRKYVQKALELYYNEAVNTYDNSEYGSFKSTLRSNKFLDKVTTKLAMKINNVRGLPNLENTAKSIKIT